MSSISLKLIRCQIGSINKTSKQGRKWKWKKLAENLDNGFISMQLHFLIRFCCWSSIYICIICAEMMHNFHEWENAFDFCSLQHWMNASQQIIIIYNMFIQRPIITFFHVFSIFFPFASIFILTFVSIRE